LDFGSISGDATHVSYLIDFERKETEESRKLVNQSSAVIMETI